MAQDLKLCFNEFVMSSVILCYVTLSLSKCCRRMFEGRDFEEYDKDLSTALEVTLQSSFTLKSH